MWDFRDRLELDVDQDELGSGLMDIPTEEKDGPDVVDRGVARQSYVVHLISSWMGGMAVRLAVRTRPWGSRVRAMISKGRSNHRRSDILIAR